MSSQQRALEIAYLIPDEYWSSTITGAVEIFHAMQRNVSVFQRTDFRSVEVTFLRGRRKKVRGFSGFSIETQYFQHPSVRDKFFDAVIVPSVWNLSIDNLNESHRALMWLKDQHQRGSLIVGLVTGVFYLAEAGLLHGREATIHWASVNIFRQRYPTVKLTPKSHMVEADSVITASTTPATFDVALLIIQRFMGDRTAEYVSHYFTIRGKESPLPTFLEPSTNDTLVDACRDRLRMQLGDAWTLEALAQQFNVTPRTLSRRFVQATGFSPISYLTKQRLELARNLLQSTTLQVQEIAEQSGFLSTTVFCRNFKKEFSLTPGQYRKKRMLAV